MNNIQCLYTSQAVSVNYIHAVDGYVQYMPYTVQYVQ